MRFRRGGNRRGWLIVIGLIMLGSMAPRFAGIPFQMFWWVAIAGFIGMMIWRSSARSTAGRMRQASIEVEKRKHEDAVSIDELQRGEKPKRTELRLGDDGELIEVPLDEPPTAGSAGIY